jgi:hypothetical protein
MATFDELEAAADARWEASVQRSLTPKQRHEATLTFAQLRQARLEAAQARSALPVYEPQRQGHDQDWPGEGRGGMW